MLRGWEEVRKEERGWKHEVDKIFTHIPKLKASNTKMKYYNQDDGTLSCSSGVKGKDSSIETLDGNDMKRL